MPKKDLFPRLLFTTACLFFAFLYGFAASQFRWFPHSFLSEALAQTKRVITDGGALPHHLHPARHDLVGVVSYDAKGRVTVDDIDPQRPGVTLLAGYWPEHDWLPGLRLIDRRGQTLHDWKVDIAAIWPKSPHRDWLAGRFDRQLSYVHGSYLFDNGDVLFNVETLGLVRMNAAGEVLWRLDRRTHHSIHRADDGNFWVCEAVWIEEGADVFRRFPGLIPPLKEDRALKVSPAGEILEELSILEIVFNSKHRSRLWTTGLAASRHTLDVLHLNDVEPLSRSMADQYPLFEAGDLMVSLCFVDLVLVVDPDTRQIKWSASEPFVRQHDPDFIGDGWISIFDNRLDESPDGQFLGGSKLMAIRPHSGETKQIYPASESASGHERRFYTGIGGKAQLLADGHWLLTEVTTGRVFEIDRDGRTVWEWGQQREGSELVSEILEGSRYELSPAKVLKWTKQ